MRKKEPVKFWCDHNPIQIRFPKEFSLEMLVFKDRKSMNAGIRAISGEKAKNTSVACFMPLMAENDPLFIGIIVVQEDASPGIIAHELMHAIFHYHKRVFGNRISLNKECAAGVPFEEVFTTHLDCMLDKILMLPLFRNNGWKKTLGKRKKLRNVIVSYDQGRTGE